MPLDQHVVVTCTLAAGPSTTAVATRSVELRSTGRRRTPHRRSRRPRFPLTAAAPTNANATTSTVNCVTSVTATTGGGAGSPATNPATVTAQAPIYALQTASNTTAHDNHDDDDYAGGVVSRE